MSLQDFARSEYVSLTTYRKDGTPVATPVWAAVDGGELFVWTKTDSWKVKRLRNDSRVRVTVCDVRGRIAEGAPSADGTGRLLDERGTARVRRVIGRKYTWKYWLLDYPAMIARLGKRPHTGIAITF
ncbi:MULTISPECIES: PPOX class F420-dependent oxidoreductase [unclassified Streptomyces]|uniref:PPOX class F420-dependent oxidoreductase n=1 Tax=unclassified Streptomyces TaxID=2593676 RepID=UPI0025531991|nr:MULTISPECIES: PPOX class F420-dependent oxidoreductase [unclassified Streptomyces]WRZ68378.1 PPOX class F420-dependent oxidoreductase [Streptomyces sp. NBC_01257]